MLVWLKSLKQGVKISLFVIYKVVVMQILVSINISKENNLRENTITNCNYVLQYYFYVTFSINEYTKTCRVLAIDIFHGVSWFVLTKDCRFLFLCFDYTIQILTLLTELFVVIVFLNFAVDGKQELQMVDFSSSVYVIDIFDF